MTEKKTVLVVDDNKVNREIVKRILKEAYLTVEAEDGRVALDILESGVSVDAVFLDLVMPIMDGYEFLKAIQDDERFKNIPVIVSTAEEKSGSEVKALQLGAWDYITKPYDPEVLKFRLSNALLRSQMELFNQLKHMSEFDDLTSLYNKNKFFTATKKMIIENPDKNFVIVRFDIDRFQLINSFFGMNEGDKLLEYIADNLRIIVKEFECATFARIEADVFAACVPYRGVDKLNEQTNTAREMLKKYPLDFSISLTFGVYIIDDVNIPVNVMLDRASLAAHKVKDNYLVNFSVYTDEMSTILEKEQEISNEMDAALEDGQFVVYYQPKYDVKSNLPCGAEALVRWNHPVKGLISPGLFIPVFEKNGFILQLDYYVWESVCKSIREWTDKGFPLNPVSVNMSRVNLYNPKLIDNLCRIADKYKVPHELLHIEVTESAYTENHNIISEMIDKLHAEGFTILMDDFGSGFSSLNILKDMNIDILKIDMNFFKVSKIPGRAENIVASIIRMAKWLNLPVIAEGVEKINQVDLLREIGCEYIQGYYYSKPLPIADYEQLIQKSEVFKSEKAEALDLNTLWESNPQMELLFTDNSQAVAIYEIEGEKIEVLRANHAFYSLFGYDDN